LLFTVNTYYLYIVGAYNTTLCIIFSIDDVYTFCITVSHYYQYSVGLIPIPSYFPYVYNGSNKTNFNPYTLPAFGHNIVTHVQIYTSVFFCYVMYILLLLKTIIDILETPTLRKPTLVFTQLIMVHVKEKLILMHPPNT